MASFSFTGPDGKPASQRMAQMRKAVDVTESDAIMAGQLMRSTILDLTAKGLNANGVAFTGYSSKGPYYYYPRGAAGRTVQQRASSASRAARSLNIVAKRGLNRKGVVGQTRLGIKFDSYRAFKLSGLGRSNVDLTGPSAPHMLQAMLVKAGGKSVASGSGIQPRPSDNSPAVSQFEIGFYGEEAGRAKGNNEGTSKVPQRHFFAASQATLAKISQLIGGRITKRTTEGAR